MKFLVLAIIAVMVVACAKKPKPEATEPTGPAWSDMLASPAKPEGGEVLYAFDNEAESITCTFAINSADIGAIAQAQVLAWVDYLMRTNHHTVLVGHACPLGEAGYNYDLGMRRARAVESALIDAGIDQSRITVQSRGESEPITTDPREYERNRRVEFTILKGQP